MAVIEGEGAVRLSVYEAVTEVETEADSVRLFDVVQEDVADEEEEKVVERVPLSVFDADFVSDGVSECVADRLPEGLRDAEADKECDSDKVAEAESGRLAERLSKTVTLLVPLTDSESDALLRVDTLRLGVALSVRQLRPPYRGGHVQ